MKKLPLAKATASLAEYVQDLKHGPLVVTIKGKPVAALVLIEGMDWESYSLGTNPDFLDWIEQSRRRDKEEGGMSLEGVYRVFHLEPGSSRKGNGASRKAKGGNKRQPAKARKPAAKRNAEK
jgi:hypothetical protein